MKKQQIKFLKNKKKKIFFLNIFLLYYLLKYFYFSKNIFNYKRFFFFYFFKIFNLKIKKLCLIKCISKNINKTILLSKFKLNKYFLYNKIINFKYYQHN